MDARPLREESDGAGDVSDGSGISSQTTPTDRPLLVAPRRYSSGDDEDEDGDDGDGNSSHDASSGAHGAAKPPSSATPSAPATTADGGAEKRASPPTKKAAALPTLDAWLKAHKPGGSDAAASRVEVEPSPSPAQESSTPAGTPGTTPSLKKRKREQPPPAANATPSGSEIKSMDDMEVSVEALRELATKHGLDVAGLQSWQKTSDGRLSDPEQVTYKSLRDALRALIFGQTGRIPREDIYFLAILRRKLAEAAMPFHDGPISVLSLGRVIPKDLFHSQKKLFPVGFECIASVQLVKADDAKIRLNCKIVEGNNQKSPIFVVSAVRDPDVMFRSYVGTKAWKKAIGHFESLSADELALFSDVSEASGTDYLLSSAGEDGFGLLRRNIARILEGGHQVLQCSEYQFWEERHSVSPDAHLKLRSRLLKQFKELLRREDLSKEEIRLRTMQESIIADYEKSPEQVLKEQLQRERERREAEKQSVRDAARKLLEIELKAQEDAKEAQRKEREDRKNAMLEAKMELVRQKEARKDATRREKEEERRMREEERDMRKFLKEEEKRRKVEEKEMHMQQKIDELRERRRLREQQKVILESGVLTARGPGTSGLQSLPFSPSKEGRAPREYSVEKQRAALLKFVHDERERRRRLKFWERRREIEESVWRRVKTAYDRHTSLPEVDEVENPSARGKQQSIRRSFPLEVFSQVDSFKSLPTELHEDVLFIWDTMSTFSDLLRMSVVPSLNSFVEILVQSLSTSTTSGQRIDETGYRSLAALNTGVLRALLEEYFHALQMGTTLEEFLRTRPINLHTWPEVARQICLLALESTHPSIDDQVVKSLKGSRLNRDDPVLTALRQRLVDRGKKLLAGEAYEDVQLKADAAEIEKARNSSRGSSTHVGSITHYGIVAEEGLASVFDYDIQDGRVVVTQLLFQKKTEEHGESSTTGPTAGFDKIKVGDYVLAINGQSVASLLNDQDFRTSVSNIDRPHGLLMSSTPPPMKSIQKHIPTTHTANKLKRCAYVLKVLRSKEIAEPFNQPVDSELYPDYYSVVPDPMDLGTIQEKIEDEEYENDDDVEAFVDDVNLVWKNCYAFNSMKAEISLMAKKLSAIFERLMEEWVESDISRPLVLGEEDHCRMCRNDSVRDCLLVCDRCDASYHTFCLSPPLKKVPSGEWYCPRCMADPSFVPEVMKRKASDGEKAGVQAAEVIEYTDLEKRLLQAVDYLSREDVRQLTLPEHVAVSRVLADILLQTSVVEDLYRSLEEKANGLRRECGDSLGDLLQEWDEFAPPKSSSGIDLTQRFIIDGTDHELTDELLDYLEEKTLAERDDRPVPELPVQLSRQSVLVDELDEPIDQSDEDYLSSEDEVQLLEELGDTYLASMSPDERPADHISTPRCNLCHLEDGIVNGSLKMCKQSPLSFIITEIDDFTTPPILSRSLDSAEEKAEVARSLLSVHELQHHEISAVRLIQTAHSVAYVPSNEAGSLNDSSKAIYCVNDYLVDGMSRDEVAQVIRGAMQPVRIFSADESIHDALHSSTTVVSFPRRTTTSLGINVGSGPDGLIFVRSLTQDGCAELSDQVFPGDVLWMINGEEIRGRSVEEVMLMLDSSSEDPSRILVLVREPSARMKAVSKSKSSNAIAARMKRTRMAEFLAQVITNPLQRSHRKSYDVTFRDGPLGLALALEGRVIVKSLNDNADGTPGQASLSGVVQAGDVIELVNGKDYGSLRDLSQFTATLVMLPRPIVIRFSREVPVSTAGPADQALDAYSDQTLLSRRLGIRNSSTLAVKTISVASEQLSSLPLVIEDFGIGNPTITSTQGTIQCNVSGSFLLVGDRLVGVNGCSTSGLSWEAVSRALCQFRGLLHLHFAERVRFPTVFYAHDTCIHQANTAWSNADSLRPKILKAKKVEELIRHVVPRSICLGKCSSSNMYYHFHGDRHRIYVRTPEKQWLALPSTATGLRPLLSHLEASVEGGDSKLVSRIRQSFPQINGISDDGGFVLEPFLQTGPFALKTEVKLIADTGEGDKLEAHISYLGRSYLLGTFNSRQEADVALKRGEQYVRETGAHTPPTLASGQQLPSLSVPSLKAEATVRRLLQRRYEYNSVVNAVGLPKRIQMSQSVVHSLRRGMFGGGTQFGYGNLATGGQGVQQRAPNSHPGVSSSTSGEYYKRKLPDSMSNSEMHQRIEAQKRARQLSTQSTQPNGPYPSPRLSPSEVAKRHLQPMADHGRAMLTAWNNYARSSTPQHTQALAFACVTSFEEVKKATTRLMADPNHPVPDRNAFVCLHHAFVIGLICAMTTQALTNSQRTNGDSVVVKAIADAFATALLCCIGPTPMVRGRAISGFAAVVKQCERALRPHDLSEPLHHIANFIVQFVQVSRYLSSGSFDDLTQCRPVVSEDPRAMDMLPASFVQQIRLLENVRRAFVARIARPGPQPPSVPTGNRASSVGRMLPNGASGPEQLLHVDFGPGPLGIMINYSARGKVVVTEYSGDRGQMGQAQASGKVSIGDEVYAINGRLVESIGGMEGFKAIVASGVRPIRVSFKSTPESVGLPGRGMTNVHRQQTPPPPMASFGYPAPSPSSVQPQLEPAPLAPNNNPQQLMYNGGATMGGLPQMMSRSMYQQQSAPHGMASSHGFSSSSFPQQGSVPGYDSLPVPYDNDSMPIANMAASAGWQQQTPQPASYNPSPLMPAPLNPRVDGNTFGTPPPFPRSSASMGFPSPPDLSAIPNRPPPAPMSMPPPYGTEFIAPNDQSSLAGDSNSISFYDANGTTFRSTPDFEIDTTATSASSVIEDETSTVEGNESILDADTEEEREESAMNSGSVSQMTTPANSDAESDTDNQRKRRTSGAPGTKEPMVSSTAHQVPVEASSALKSGPSEPRQTQTESIDVDEDMTLSMARRSARVPRKITTNIADIYNPELNGSARGRGSSSTPGQSEIVEPTHGEVGELATELLEDFPATIRTSKADVPATLQLLRAQLLTMEATIPREAFRLGKWTREIRAAWGEMVYSCDSAAALMEATLLLESVLENDWLEPYWRSALLPTARYAVNTATIASVAMRLCAFDEGVSYVRVKRGGGRRKQTQQRSGASSEQSSPVKATMIDLTSSNATAMHPLDLQFVAKLRRGTIDVANRIVDRVLAMQRDRIQNVVAHRQALRELAALTDLSDDQIDQWIRAAANQTQQMQQASRSLLNVSSTAVGGSVGSSTRQPTPKRKAGGTNDLPGSSNGLPNRKRKAAATQRASLPCFQTRDTAYQISAHGQDPTLRGRLELIVGTLLKNELALPFAAPVNVRDVPGYTDVIEQPMDLGTIQQRLSRGFYDGRFELVSQDVNLVWTNCFRYNRVDSEISKCANRLRSIYNRLFEQWISNQAPGTPVASLPSEEACRTCQQSHASDRMLLCDSCDAAYHLFCLSPPLAEIPSGDWFCPRCPIQQLTV